MKVIGWSGVAYGPALSGTDPEQPTAAKFSTTMLNVLVSLASILLAARPASAQQQLPFWEPPPRELLRKAWPKDPSGRLIYGRLKLNCAVGADSSPLDCLVDSTTPDRPELTQAALSLASLYKAKAKSDGGRADLYIGFEFDTLPEFIRIPDANQVSAVYPPDAAHRGLNGLALMHCWLKTNGHLRDCEIKDETPPSSGFGSASLRLAQIFLMKPATREGQPVESEVTLPMRFRLH
jgi:TonB family protein